MPIRVLVYNVRAFRDGPERVVGVVNRFAPTVVMLNESGGRLALRRFAKRVGMIAARDPRSPFARRVKDAVLVRPPWRILERRLHRFPTKSRWYPRGALIARLGDPGPRLWVVSVHLGLQPVERHRHAEELVDVMSVLDEPVVIGGDLNETPSGRAVSHVSDRFTDAWLSGGDVSGETFPAEEPTARIDYLFVSPSISVERVLVPPTPDVRSASDHRPIVAELTLPG